MPGSWGLEGQAFEEAEAAYYYDGEDLERRLAEIRLRDKPAELKLRLLDLDLAYGKITAYEHDLAFLRATSRDTRTNILELDLRHGRITAYEFDRTMVEISTPDGAQRDAAMAAVDLKHGKITQCEHDKRIADINDEPWIGIKDHGFDPAQGMNGVYFEFDWNDRWIEFLRLNGYVGQSDEEIVEQWFGDICRSQSATIRPNGSSPFAAQGES